MALIVITVQDTDKGAVVSLAAEPQLNLAEAPSTAAQNLVHLMLAALPMNKPANDASEPALSVGAAPAADGPAPTAAPEVKFPM